MPVIGPFGTAFRWREVEFDSVVAERIERIGRDATDELGIFSFRGNTAVREVVVARKNLKDIDVVGSNRTLGEMTKQFRCVVRRVGPSPLQFDEDDMVCGVTGDIDWRARYPVFGPPYKLWVQLREGITQPGLNGGGEFAHKLV